MFEDPSPPADQPLDEAAVQDLRWMELVKQGDTEAFRLLVEAHQFRVVATVAKMLGNDAEAEDIAQQVFVRVWRSAPRYEPTARFTTWLFKITRNLVLNEIRRRGRHRTESLDSTEDGERAPIQAVDTTTKAPDDSVLNEEMQDAIQKAIDQLPETQRMAVILRRYDEFSYEEIAEIMGLTVPAVKSVLFRARTDLREKLRKYLQG